MTKPDIRSLFNGETSQLIGMLFRDQAPRFWKQYLVAVFCLALVAGTTAFAAYLMKDVINKIFLEKNEAAVGILAGTIIVIYSVKGAATFGQQVILTRISNAIVASFQGRLFHHLLQMDLRHFASQHTAEIVSRQGYMASSCGNVLNTVILSLGRDLLTLVGLVVVLVAQDPLLSAFCLIVMPLAVFGVQKLVRKARRAMDNSFHHGVRAAQTIQEAVLGMTVVKSFCLEEVMEHRLGDAIVEIEKAANKLASVGARSNPLMETLGGFAIAGVILYGGWQVTSAGKSPGEFFSFITALLLAYDPAKRLARVHIELGANLVGVRMMFNFLASPPAEPADEHLPALEVQAGRISFEKVVFAYRPDEPVLRGIDLVAEAGQTTALVGRSGGGKSTILALLMRLYEADSGVITVDGVSTRDVTRKSLRRSIAYVGQDIYLFKGSIAQNIAFGRENATREEIEAAARAAYAHDFILGFQDGYDTQVGENGTALSGGQKQRIAIARAILKDAPILLLDEATAALDTESERAIQRALENLSVGRTTLVIAHRLQTIERADKICVIEQGVVVEQGSHARLIEERGRYAALHHVQFE